MVGLIKKERGGAPDLSFVTSLKVEGIIVSCWLALSRWLVLGDIGRRQLARQEGIALVWSFFDLAIPTSKADFDYLFVLPIKHALSVLQVSDQSVDFLSRNLNVSGHVRALVAFLVLFFDSELNEVDAEVRHGLVEEFGDDDFESLILVVAARLHEVTQLASQLVIEPHIEFVVAAC